jgi:hypothetical protein
MNAVKFFLKKVFKTGVILSIVLSSCTENSGPVAKKGTDSSKVVGGVDEASIKSQGMKDPQTSEAFDPNVLQSYLPEFIKTFKGTPASTGTGFRKGYSWTQVTRSYTIPTGDLRVMITDYADIDDFLQPKIKEIQAPTTAGEGESIRNLNPGNNALAYESWSSVKHSGRLEAIVAKRFYIEITGTNLPPEFTSLEEVLKEINIGRLAQFPAKK